MALSGKFATEGKNQKTIPIDILGTQLSLVTLFRNLPESGHTQVLSSFLCYKGFPLAYSANSSSLALSDNNRNIHHFALGELQEKIPNLQEYPLFGDALVMTLVQKSLPLLVGDKINLGYQRISCQSNRSLFAQNYVTAQEEIRGIAETYRSNFPRIYKFSEASLQESAYDIGKVRSEIGDPSIIIGSEKILAIPRRYPLLKDIDRVISETWRPAWANR